MRLYSCQYCSLPLFFENTHCIRCRSELGYWAETDSLVVLEPGRQGSGEWTSFAVPGLTLRCCSNSRFGVCNWMVDAASQEGRCTSCRHNRVVPSTDTAAGLASWRKIESAKHKLFASLHRLGLIDVIERAGVATLGFQFLEDGVNGTPPVMTGHANGLITIATKEADDVEREQRRSLLGEPYRTVLGHFRHESAHYFWDRLVRDTGRLAECRAVFGNDRIDYQAAVGRHYLQGAPAGWQKAYVSPYATMHPWEDFAETWAHYLHMVATLDTAYAYQLRIAPPKDRFRASWVDDPVDPYEAENIDTLVNNWMPLTTMLNSLNGAMGKDDAYPFVLTAPVIGKLGYVHWLIRQTVAEIRSDARALLLS